MFSKWHHCRPTFSETGSRYVVLVGDVRAGKSTLTEKLTNVPCLKSDQSRSFTTNSDIFRTADGMLEICDTPGTNPLEDKFTHNIWIAQAFNRKPVSLLLIVVKADRGISNVIDSVTKYAEGFFDIFHILGVCVTHMDDDGITWTEGNFKEALSELGLESVIFSSSTSTGDDLRRDVEAICSRKPEDVSVDSENFFKFFKLNDSNFKLLHSVRKEVQRLEMVIRKFQDIYGMREDSDSSQLDLLFEFALWMRAWILGAQCRVSADTSYVKGPEKASEAGHLTNLTNQLTDVLMELWTEIETFSDIRDDSFRKCPHCGKIWAKSNKCDLYCWEGSRCIGNSTYEREQMFNLCRQIKNDADEGLVLVGETGSFVFRWTDSSSKLEIDSIGPNNEDDEDDKLNATASFKHSKHRHNIRGCRNRLEWKDMAPSKVPPEFEVAEDAMEVCGDYGTDERSKRHKGRGTMIKSNSYRGATVGMYGNSSADLYSSRRVSGIPNMGWESTFRTEMYSCYLSGIPFVSSMEPSVKSRKTSNFDAGLTKSRHVSNFNNVCTTFKENDNYPTIETYDSSKYTSSGTQDDKGSGPSDDSLKPDRVGRQVLSKVVHEYVDENNKRTPSSQCSTFNRHEDKSTANDLSEKSVDSETSIKSLSEKANVKNDDIKSYFSSKNITLVTPGERNGASKESAEQVKSISDSSQAHSEYFKVNIDENVTTQIQSRNEDVRNNVDSKSSECNSSGNVFDMQNLGDNYRNSWTNSSSGISSHVSISSSSFDPSSRGKSDSVNVTGNFSANIGDYTDRGELSRISVAFAKSNQASSTVNGYQDTPINNRHDNAICNYSKCDNPTYSDTKQADKDAGAISKAYNGNGLPANRRLPSSSSRSNFNSECVASTDSSDIEKRWRDARNDFNLEKRDKIIPDVSGKKSTTGDPHPVTNYNSTRFGHSYHNSFGHSYSRTFLPDRRPNSERLNLGIMGDSRTSPYSYDSTHRPQSSYQSSFYRSTDMRSSLQSSYNIRSSGFDELMNNCSDLLGRVRLFPYRK